MNTHKNKKSSKNAKSNRRQPVAKSSRLSRSKSFNKKSHSNGRRVIIGVIIAVMIAVIVAIVVALLNTPERTTTAKIQEIARDYYENYYYDQLVKTSSAAGKTLDEALGHYSDVGFSKVNLSQLFLFDGGRHRNIRSSITNYCDETNTTITIYPDAPYGRKDYHIDYNYSCNF